MVKKQSKASKNNLKSFVKQIDILKIGIILALLSIVSLAYLIILTDVFDKDAATTKIHQVGQTVRVENTYEITLDNIKDDEEMAKMMRLPDNQTLKVAHAKITNLSSEPLNYLPALHSYIRDDQGVSYSIFADVSQPALPPKILQKGETIEGNLAFLIDKRDVPMWLYFDTHFMDESPVVFKIK